MTDEAPSILNGHVSRRALFGTAIAALGLAVVSLTNRGGAAGSNGAEQTYVAPGGEPHRQDQIACHCPICSPPTVRTGMA